MKIRVLVRAASVGPSLSLLRMLGVILLWLAGGCVDVAFAQASRVDGVVRDSSGAAVQGATVELHAGAVDRKTTTDAAGEFVFDGLNATSGTVVVTLNGFQTASQAMDDRERGCSSP